MTSIFKRVDDALETISPAVAYAMAPYLGTLPATFITYQLIISPPEQSANNAETLRSYTVQVNIYSQSGLDSLPDVDAVMTVAGFKKGPWRQLPKNVESGHYGLAKDYVYVESI
jgi:hypothetical protein